MKRLSEILEECIEAGIAGRRSLEESLALYPAQAAELEPLLRTALSVSDSFQSYAPPAAVQQRIRDRFLADAAARRNLRHLESSFERRGWLAGLFGKPVFGGFAAAAAAVAVAVMAVTVAGVDLGGGSDDGGASVSVTVSSGVVSDLGSRVNSISERIDSGGQIESADLAEISALLARLKDTPADDLQASAAELEATLPGTLALLEAGSGIAPDDPVVMDAIDATRDIAAAIKLDLPGPVDAGDATPAPTEKPAEATPVPVKPTPVPGGGGGTTAPPTKTPSTPAPTPTSTADDRAPPGFLP
ncbi:MAG TPA: hypothetical protein VIW01_10320 [Dehalococcoidia bacterium]